MSQFRWFHKRQRRVLLKDRRDCRSPWTTLNGGPTTRELSLPRDNSAARLLLTAPCSLLSLTRFAFRLWPPSQAKDKAGWERRLHDDTDGVADVGRKALELALQPAIKTRCGLRDLTM
jgi:hypothetical protein